MASSSPPSYHLHVLGKWQSPEFHRFRSAAENLSNARADCHATIEGYFEAQFEQKLKKVVSDFGGAFIQAKPGSGALVYCLTSAGEALYFATAERFFEWAQKR